ncbi:MAG: hypothetical protein IJ828_09555 [Treponema sp.]|nr:hypothetical protein [Treponema sp.]
MQINYYEETEKIRIRDKILKDDDIRNAATNVVQKLCTVKNMEYNEKTGSVLIEFQKETLPLEKLQSLIPMARKLQSKVNFYTPKKKSEILNEIEKIEQTVGQWA